MSIRMKLLLSNAAMLLIPLVLIVLTTLLLILVFRGDLQNIKSIYDTKEEAFFGNDEAEHYFSQSMRASRRNPAQLTDSSYLQQLDQELHDSGASVIVRIGDRLTYVSGDLQANRSLLDHLPKFSHPGEREREEPKRSGNVMLMLSRYDLTAADNQPASVFLVSRLDPLAYFAKRSFPILFISLLIILVLTHSLLTYFVSKSIIRPLQALKKGAKQMKDGNLDLPVRVKGKDEIGQLGVAFEEMRVQLRESIRIQQQYEANRKELVANISHDLKTPITSIKGYVDGIMDGVADTPLKVEKYVRTIASKADQLDRLIDELMLFSKLDLNRVPYHFEQVDIRGFLTDWMEEMHFELEKKAIRVESDIALNGTVSVLMDRDKFKRVLSNVIENGVKYMDKADRRIRLRAYAAEGRAVLEIADNGQGIEAEALPFIFERFYRAEESRSTQTGGSGLGLSIAKQIVEGHGGEISAVSVRGEGTCITISLVISHI